MEETKTPILVDNLLFAIAYPESYKLVRRYYDTLTTTCINNHKFMKFDGEKFSPFQNKSKDYVISRIKQIEQSTYTLYFPLFENTDFLKEGNFDRRAIENMYYKNRMIRISENDDLRERKIAYEIYYQLIDSEDTLDNICKTYNMGSDKIHQILQDNLKETEYRIVLETLKRNSLKKYYEMTRVIERLYDYIPNGIKLNDGTKVPFNMLDYYSLTYLSPSTIIAEMEKKKPNNKAEAIARAISKKYLNKNKKQGPYINREMLLGRGMKRIKDNQEFSIEDYIDEIFSTFKEYNIPQLSGLLDSAFIRISRNVPITQKEEVLKK